MNKELRSQYFLVGYTSIQFQAQSLWVWKRDCSNYHVGLCSLGYTLFLVLASATLSVAAPADIVATVDGQPIFVREIDEQSSVQINRLQEELGALLTRTVDRLIDEQLRAVAPPEMLELPPPL